MNGTTTISLNLDAAVPVFTTMALIVVFVLSFLFTLVFAWWSRRVARRVLQEEGRLLEELVNALSTGAASDDHQDAAGSSLLQLYRESRMRLTRYCMQKHDRHTGH